MRLALAVALLLAAVPAVAFEGRVQISSAPYTISQSGSYVVTQNLTVMANQTAITVNADFVTIDLNGFAIQGPNTCSYASGVVTCTALGTGQGIFASGRQGITVRNGAIRGTGAAGLVAGIGARIENVTVSQVGGQGIDVSHGGSVRRASAQVVDGTGIRCGTGCLLADNRVHQAELDGISAGNSLYRENDVRTAGRDAISGLTTVGGSLFEGNVARDTGDDGLTAIGGFAFFDNTSTLNAQTPGSDGAAIDVLDMGLVVGNTLADSTDGFGFESTGRVLVMENTITANSGVGINMVSGNACYGRNVLSQNPGTGAQTAGNAIQNDYNSCGRDLPCP
jgi:hypothetical protein